MTEIWKDVVGYEGLYLVSENGAVKSVKRKAPVSGRQVHEKMLSPWFNFRGYMLVTLHKNGKKNSIPVHILVAKAFIDNPENKPEVNHCNGIKTDNHKSNLEWNTRLENQRHSVYTLGKHHAGEAHYRAKLKVSQIIEMRELFKTGRYSKAEIGRMFGVGKDHAINIINGRCWKTLKTA